MSDKREGSTSPPPPKRPRLSYEDELKPSRASTEQPRNDAVYGQRGAFPGLDDGGDELFYGPADDGLEYLRMVRSEANSLPTLFVAPTQSADPQDPKSISLKHPLPVGFFASESAYIAPVIDTNEHKDLHSASNLEKLYPDAQVAYYNLLRHRFRLLRSTLRCSPPADAISGLDSQHPISLPRNAGSAHKEWRRLLQAVDPQMVQVACMDMDSVLEVLEIVARMMSDVVRSEHVERIRRVGAWAWALLGKCREVGQLTTEEVGVIRNLGKRATTILCKVQETETIRSQGTASSLSIAEVDAEGDDSKAQPTHDEGNIKQDGLPESAEVQDSTMHDASPEDVELEAAKTRLQASLQGDNNHVGTPLGTDEEYLANQIRALLDMTITVVGEFYGQRDLLEAREVWA